MQSTLISGILLAVGKGARERAKRRLELQLREAVGKYEPTDFPAERLVLDKSVSQLGAPIDGWIPELTYRWTILEPEQVIVDWAIMIDVYRIDQQGDEVDRRRVERIDICHSEIHVHSFRKSFDTDDDVGRRNMIASISAGDMATVNSAFEVQIALVSHEWASRVRRWIDG